MDGDTKLKPPHAPLGLRDALITAIRRSSQSSISHPPHKEGGYGGRTPRREATTTTWVPNIRLVWCAAPLALAWHYSRARRSFFGRWETEQRGARVWELNAICISGGVNSVVWRACRQPQWPAPSHRIACGRKVLRRSTDTSALFGLPGLGTHTLLQVYIARIFCRCCRHGRFAVASGMQHLPNVPLGPCRPQSVRVGRTRPYRGLWTDA